MSDAVPVPASDAAAGGGDGALVVQPGLAIPRAELQFQASRSGGPGGQHVNTSSTRIQLSWNVRRSTAISEDQRALLEQKLASRLDGEGNVKVVAQDMRSQLQNREKAEERLAEVVRRALVVQKRRKATKPSRGAREARLQEKKKHSGKKAQRRTGFDE